MGRRKKAHVLTFAEARALPTQFAEIAMKNGIVRAEQHEQQRKSHER